MVATLRDVAEATGYSVKTVSAVLNDYPYVRQTTRDTVKAAAAALGYQPNQAARNLRAGRTGAITLAVPKLSLSYFAELADAVITVAKTAGLVVRIEQTGGDRDAELELLQRQQRGATDGLLFSPLGLGQNDVDLLRVDFPLVLLGERIVNAPVDHVSIRNAEAARAATKHLIDLGRRRIAVIGAHPGAGVGSAHVRLEGHKAALAEAGLPFDETLMGFASPWHRLDGARAMTGLLRSGIRFDAVFGLNDLVALGAMHALQSAGRSVPDDVAVIGFDDLDESRYSLPTLSTIDPGRPEIAETAVRILIERIAEKGGAAPPRLLSSDYKLVIRASTSGVREDFLEVAELDGVTRGPRV